ncbi:glycosyl transferase [Pilimelia anulata]|uniref:Glycosyl transferase n=1 Tax=Pilimelia anulata TaxID=53371 RepID=A0A8J3BBW9_9ACTN|nr:glycosyl transferase [Pilimelia anulata]
MLVCAGYLVAAFVVLSQLWVAPTERVLSLNAEDQTLYEWFLANDTLLWTGGSGLLSDRLNAPEGFNLMANTTVIALGLLGTPVTLAFGAPVTFALFATLNLAGTAAAWYLLFARGLRRHRLAAGIAGAFCGFAPGMVSQNISHLHMSAQWLVPLMVWWVIVLARTGDPAAPRRERAFWVASLALAATVFVQVFIGEEVLFLTAFTLLFVVGAYALARPAARRAAPRFLAAMAVTAVVAGAALAYPLWFQFLGPQGVKDGIFAPDYFSADLASWIAISPLSLAGSDAAARLTTGPSEYNTFLGLPLILVAVAGAVWLIRKPAVLACAVGALVMAAFSLGPKLVVNGERTGFYGPYMAIKNVPVIDGALPMRFALAAIPLVAAILAYVVHAALRRPERAVRWGVPALVAAALLPIAPAPLPVSARPPLPTFISGGAWKQCAPENGVLVTVPLATPPRPGPMRYPTATNIAFAIPEGFFIGPYGTDGSGAMGVSRFPIAQWLEEVATSGAVPPVGPADRDALRVALEFWRADCVAVVDAEPNAEAIRTALTALFARPGARLADATTWRVERG